MIRVATWNMKQAVAPKKPLPDLWEWMEAEIDPAVIVLTKARVPKDGLPEGWTAIWTPGGIGPRRTWGTIIAARDLELKEAKFKRNSKRKKDYIHPHPATLHTADIVIDGDTWATIVGADIAQHASPVSINESVLTIQTTSTAWATQLTLVQSEVLKTIQNNPFGATIESVAIIGPNTPSWKRGIRSTRDARGPRDTYN